MSAAPVAQPADQAVHAALAGRSVSDVLRELSSTGLQFLFSSSLLPDSMRVLDEPPAPRDAVATARLILAPHGLALSLVQPGLYAVVPSVAQPPTRVPETSPDAPAQQTEELRELVVAASRFRVGNSAAAFTLDRLGLTEQPVLGDDPLRALARLPGITLDGLSAQANVRGGEAGEVLMLLDGYPLRRVFHLSGYQSLFSVLDTGLIRGVDVFTGGYPAQYGNRMAGVFDFHTVRSTDEPQHSLGIDFFNASGRTAGTWERAGLGYVASGRIGTLSPLLHAFAPSVGDPRYADAYARLERGDPDSLRISLNFLLARDELGISDVDRGEEAQIEERSRYLWLRADRDFTNSLSGSLWFGQSVIESYRSGSVDSPGIVNGNVRDSRSSRIWDLRSQLQWQPTDAQVVIGGVEFTEERAAYDYAANASFSPAVLQLFGGLQDIDRDASLDPKRRRSSLFVSHRWQLNAHVTTELGLRAQGIVSTGLEATWIAEPRFGLRWQLGPDTRINVGWGVFHQADEVHELKVEDGLDNFPSPQRSDHLVAGIEHDVGAVALRAEVFSKRQTEPRARFENQLNRRSILPEIAPDRVQVLPDLAELEGLEVSGELRSDTWRAWAAASWAVANDETGGVQTARSWDQTWSVTTGARWERGPWALSGNAQLHRGFPITALNVTGTGPLLGPRNAARLPNFLQLDLRLQYTQPTSTGSLVYSFEVINATNQPNDCCTELQTGPQGLYGRPLQGLPLFPSLGVRWNW